MMEITKTRKEKDDAVQNDRKLAAEYKDDLEYLNKFQPKVIDQMHSMFKNEGRGLKRVEKKMEEEGRWAPHVGSVNPKYDQGRANESQRLLTISPPPKKEAAKRKKSIYLS